MEDTRETITENLMDLMVKKGVVFEKYNSLMWVSSDNVFNMLVACYGGCESINTNKSYWNKVQNKLHKGILNGLLVKADGFLEIIWIGLVSSTITKHI